MHIVIAGKLHPAAIELLDSQQAVTYDYVEAVDDSYLEHIGKADGLVLRTQKFGAQCLAKASKLRIVARHGVGYDAVDVDALNARNIALAIVGDVNSRTVAEHTMTLLLAAFKRLLIYDAACRTADGWSYRDSLEAREVYGKTLLIVGFGRIGRQLAVMARVFGMQIAIYDPYVDRKSLDADVAIYDDLDVGLANADAVSLHLPKIDGQLIGKEQLAKMRPNAVIVNAARGGLIDEHALAEALASGQIFGAGLDVFAQEPLGDDHALAQEDLAILSPHIAGLTQECANRMAVMSVQNILNYFDKTIDPSLVVNADHIEL